MPLEQLLFSRVLVENKGGCLDQLSLNCSLPQVFFKLLLELAPRFFLSVDFYELLAFSLLLPRTFSKGLGDIVGI